MPVVGFSPLHIAFSTVKPAENDLSVQHALNVLKNPRGCLQALCCPLVVTWGGSFNPPGANRRRHVPAAFLFRVCTSVTRQKTTEVGKGLEGLGCRCHGNRSVSGAARMRTTPKVMICHFDEEGIGGIWLGGSFMLQIIRVHMPHRPQKGSVDSPGK